MEMPAKENSEPFIPSDVADRKRDNGAIESKHEIAEEEVRSILEVIAATGKFWHEWDKLKNMLSFNLKQVLSVYPEAKMTSDQQNSLLGEAYSELVKRLDDALRSFVEGPPFTLQRLCEILLAAQSIYPNLSKLALALEKDLMVTSTLAICTDPYPTAMVQTPKEPEEVTEETVLQTGPIENGVNPTVKNDETMADAEANVDMNLLVTSTLAICTDPYPPSMVQTPNEPEEVTEETGLQSGPVENGVNPTIKTDETMADAEADVDMVIDNKTY